MPYRFKTDLTYADVTPRRDFLNRRQIMTGAAALGAGSILSPALAQSLEFAKTPFGEGLKSNTYEEITSYCNYYEFGTGKDDPARNAGSLTTDPWSVEIGGLVERPGNYDLSDILKDQPLEERIYRFRCVEAWSMVIPWIGFQLSDLLAKVGVQPGAKYVAFQTAYRPDEMPGLASRVLDWPYREGLRLDEAMHPLTMIATGLYGDPLPNQNGAPLRLVVPWKYGFKSIKSIVKIELTEEQPFASWNDANPREYGFYSNVNPTVDHPRWSQATERRIGDGLFARRRDTLMFNGYGDEVADLYAGQDLTVDI